MDWFSYIPHGRCWLHLIWDILKKLKKHANKEKEKQQIELLADLQVLYENKTLAAANRWYRHLLEKYDTEVLMPLHNAWPQLKLWWELEIMPLTNNTSEHLYSELWSRTRKRDKRTNYRRKAWLTEAAWRHNHKPLYGTTPFESFFSLSPKTSSLDWLFSIIPKAHTNFP
ncbi:MAG TPA: hypothetical protein ENK21_05155 [Trueperaceae bacterium]|nr:hypothetical protein [Trueperaceae bacterium]